MPFAISIEVETGPLSDLTEQGRRAISRAIELLALDVWGNIAREAPRDHGKLAGSFKVRKEGEMSYTVFTPTEYASFVHEGTGIYGPAGRRITPKRASVLVFDWMGDTWFRKSVAGQRPNPFADRAIAKSERRAEDFAKMAVAEVFA